MEMVYNSSQFAVVAFEMPAKADAATPTPIPLPMAAEPTATDPNAQAAEPAATAAAVTQAVLKRGGYEIVDKFARKEIFIEGALAERFQQGVQALVEAGPTEESMDEFIAGYTALAQHPVVLH